MSYILPTLALTLALAGCARPKCCDLIDTSVYIRYASAQSRDWLRATNLKANDMEVYAVCDGKKQRVYNANYDAPKSLRLVREPDTARTVLQLYANDCGASSTTESVTLLEFPDHSVDTVACRFDHRDGNILCTSVRYNGQLRWNGGNNGRVFTVVK